VAKLFDESFFAEMRRLQREMDRLFSQFMQGHPLLPGPQAPGKAPYRMPVADLVETESGYVASIELPGVAKKDIELSVTPQQIVVRVDTKVERSTGDKEKGTFQHSAVSRQFYRAFPLPKLVIPEKTKAELRDGMLRVEVPKSAKAGGFRVDIE